MAQFSTDGVTGQAGKQLSLMFLMVCAYVFLVTERPWESIRYLHGIQVERYFAVAMMLTAFFNQKMKIVASPSNKWVYGLLLLHFALAPFSFSPDDAVDQGVEYLKMIILYLLMLSVVDDEHSLRLLVQVFVISVLLYASHSLWEYHNGRHVYTMGITRMVGVDSTFRDPNSFGASVILALPFVYALLPHESSLRMRALYYSFLALATVCVVLTGSRSAFVGLVFLLLLWALLQKGWRRVGILTVAAGLLSTVWLAIPAEKQERIRSIWDHNAGPANAHASTEGRYRGFNAGIQMFRDRPLTGVGAGGKNFIAYRVKNLDGISEQAHNLYAEVLGELGAGGGLLFLGMVAAIGRSCLNVRKILAARGEANRFSHLLAGAIMVCLCLLLVLGLAGHNFYRPLWLWLAAWSGSLVRIAGGSAETAPLVPASSSE